MSDTIIVAIIAAVPSVCTFLLTAAVVFHAWHVPHKLQELVEHTNGLTEQLIGKSATVARAEGVQQEKDRVAVAADTNTVVMLAAAQLAADKIVAAVKVAKDADS